MDLIQLSRPSITDEEIAASERVLRSGYLVNGPEARAFEEELAAACGRRYAAVVSSGTAALHLALHALWARERAEAPAAPRLLVPAFTFPATGNVAAFLPWPMPVTLCDVEEESFCAPAAVVARHLAAGRGPAMVVHQFGYPAPLPDAATLGPAARLLISDAACAISVPGAMKGAAVCLSFHPRKLLTTGEGGAVLSDDEGLIAEIKALRAHGLLARPGEEVMAEPGPGINYRLPEVGAAIGRVQLRRLPGLIEAHRERALRYRERLAVALGDRALRFQGDAPGRVWQTLAVVLPAGVDRQALRARLREGGIETQIASYGLHRLAAFSSAEVLDAGGACAGASPATLPVAERLHERGLALPLHAGLAPAQVDAVCEALLRLLPAA